MVLSDHHGRTNLHRAALKRLNDAKALFRAGKTHTGGAAYLGGYAVECKLKAIAMEVYNCWTLDALARKWGVRDREVYTHGLEAILRHLPQYDRFKKSAVWRSAFSVYVNQWRVSWRYDPADWNDEKCDRFLTAVEDVYNWLNHHRG